VTSPTEVGLVLADGKSRPLEFWVEIHDDAPVQLDDLVALELSNPIQPETPIRVYGVVDDIIDDVEGLSFPGDTRDLVSGAAFARRILKAHISVTRFQPNTLRPPRPGTPVHLARGERLLEAMFVDRMGSPLPIGVLRNGQPAYVNFDFINGNAGAHINISGVSGVATKTSFALWVLYSILHAKNADGEHVNADRANSKALIFNVKGTDLFYIGKPNKNYRDVELDVARQAGISTTRYAVVGLPEKPFDRVAIRTPPEPGGDQLASISPGPVIVTPYAWTLLDFCKNRMLPMMFALDPGSQNLRFLTEDIAERLQRLASDDQRGPHVLLPPPPAPLVEDEDDPIHSTEALAFDDLTNKTRVRTLRALGEYLEQQLLDGTWARSSRQAQGTVEAFIRRFKGAARHIENLVRGDLPASEFRDAALNPLGSSDMVHVIDLHDLPAAGQAFVVGVTLERVFSEREENKHHQSKVFVVLDELNKYAPSEGDGPIKRLLLDIAERGRSLGVILIGAQQTASEVERRIVANAAIRVVGRLDSAEATRPEYRFLPSTLATRASLLDPGSMIIHQPNIPTPLLVSFPYPVWATRKSEVEEAPPDLDDILRLD
jgi:DNA helicase HerA-like ATPase